MKVRLFRAKCDFFFPVKIHLPIHSFSYSPTWKTRWKEIINVIKLYRIMENDMYYIKKEDQDKGNNECKMLQDKVGGGLQL